MPEIWLYSSFSLILVISLRPRIICFRAWAQLRNLMFLLVMGSWRISVLNVESSFSEYWSAMEITGRMLVRGESFWRSSMSDCLQRVDAKK